VTSTPTAQDRVRQLVVTLAYLVCVLGALLGVGLLGGEEVEDASGGALSAESTLVAPAGPAFSIWSVIYVGLTLYLVLQWLPPWAAQPRQREIGYLAAASMVLNAAWIGAVQVDRLWLSVLVIVVLLVVLCRIIVVLARDRGRHPFEAIAVDATFGLYLGWVVVATAANLAAALADAGFEGGPLGPEPWAVAVCLLVAVVGVLLALRLGARLAPAAAMVWGLCWVAVARSSVQPRSTVTTVAALAAAVVVAVATFALRVRRR